MTALAIFEEFQILLLEAFTVLQTFRKVKMSPFKHWQMAGLPYHEAVSKAAQVPGSLGSPGCVHLLQGQLLFEHSLESCMVCQHPLEEGSEKMGQGFQMSNKTSSQTPLSRFSHGCNNWYLSSSQERVTKHSLKSMYKMCLYCFISTVLKHKDATLWETFSQALPPVSLPAAITVYINLCNRPVIGTWQDTRHHHFYHGIK